MKNKTLYLFLALSLTLLTCKKKQEEEIVHQEKVSFDIKCVGCSISYPGDDGVTRTESNISEVFAKKYNSHVNLEITIKVRTTAIFKIMIEKNHGTTTPYTQTFTKDTYLTYSKDTKKVNDGSSTPPTGGGSNNSGCGIYNGKSLYLGPQGGCYYLNSSGNKSYVDRSYCKCN